MSSITTAPNLEKFCFDLMDDAIHSAVDFAGLTKVMMKIFWEYQAEVERRKSDRKGEALKYSIIIDVETDESVPCELCNRLIESGVSATLQQWADRNALRIVNIEAAHGSLAEAFGVGLK